MKADWESVDSAWQRKGMAVTALSLLLFTKTWKPSGSFLKKKPTCTRPQCQKVKRKCSSHPLLDCTICAYSIRPPCNSSRGWIVAIESHDCWQWIAKKGGGD